GTLHGSEKLSVEPVTFLNRDRKQFVVIVHLGKKVCGHQGIVHGGVQATLFDEITARPAFWNLPRNIALTATLKVNYRRPVLADQILVFRTQLANIEGRKATVTAKLEDVNGNVLSDAEALYISPSNEKLL
ncbi:HotDog domain-containing protein, partial [Coemansia spiralis]